MANRETQVTQIDILVGNPNARASQVAEIVILGPSPNFRASQVFMIVIVPNVPNSTPPGGTLKFVQEFVMP